MAENGFAAALKHLLAGKALTRAAARDALGAVLDGKTTDAQIGAF